MAKIDLTKYGITGTTEIVYNPSYEMLFEEETKPGLEGFEKGRVSELGAVNVMTGIYTGRSPKDKYIVMDENSKDTVWWTSDEYKNDNHPASQEAWEAVKEIAKKELSDKRLFVVDAFCGANKDTRMAIRFIVEVAWQAHFVTNMFIQPFFGIHHNLAMKNLLLDTLVEVVGYRTDKHSLPTAPAPSVIVLGTVALEAMMASCT